jgi:hypothetical protein
MSRLLINRVAIDARVLPDRDNTGVDDKVCCAQASSQVSAPGTPAHNAVALAA